MRFNPHRRKRKPQPTPPKTHEQQEKDRIRQQRNDTKRRLKTIMQKHDEEMKAIFVQHRRRQQRIEDQFATATTVFIAIATIGTIAYLVIQGAM